MLVIKVIFSSVCGCGKFVGALIFVALSVARQSIRIRNENSIPWQIITTSQDPLLIPLKTTQYSTAYKSDTTKFLLKVIRRYILRMVAIDPKERHYRNNCFTNDSTLFVDCYFIQLV